MQQHLATTFFVLGLCLSACGGNTPPVSDPAAPDTTASPPAPDTTASPPAPDTTASPPAPTAEVPDAVETSTREYIECGCGCCGGTAPVDASACVSDAELDAIIAKDKTASGCETVGCSQGTRYRVCP